MHHSRFSERASTQIGNWLAIAVAIIGTVLVRFAFHQPERTNGAAPVGGLRSFWKKDRKRDLDASSLVDFATHKRMG